MKTFYQVHYGKQNSAGKKTALFFLIFFALTFSLSAQQYYNYNTTTGGNAFPFSVVAGKVIQWLYLPGEINQPTPAPSGNITTIYFKCATATITFTNLTIKMRQDTITTLPTGVFYTGGPFDTVYFNPSVQLVSVAGNWMSITLNTPYNYDNTKSLLIEVNQCGATSTGMTIYNTTLTGIRRVFNQTAGGCNYIYQGQSGQLANLGIDVAPPPPPLPPVLLSPPHNSTGRPLTDSLRWNSSAGATSYRVQLATDSTFSTLIVNDSTVTQTYRVVSGLTNLTSYWWRVNAKNVNGTGTYSSVFKFTTVLAAPAPPVLVSPLHNSTGVSITPLLDWNTSATATSYRLQLSTDSTFATVLLDSTTSFDSLKITAPGLSNNVRYFWHVLASNAGGNSAYSLRFSFVTNPLSVIGSAEIPKVYRLYPSFPNPFNPVSTIKFDIPKSSDVKLFIYNSIGQQVGLIVNGVYEAGSYSVRWDASNYPSGVYFYKLAAGNFTDNRKMVLIK